jgi:hypothetical protein
LTPDAAYNPDIPPVAWWQYGILPLLAWLLWYGSVPRSRRPPGGRHMSETETLRGAAITRLMRRGYSLEYCETVVDLVLVELRHPDQDMLNAGLVELDLAMGTAADKEHGRRYRKELLQVIWAAMLYRAS